MQAEKKVPRGSANLAAVVTFVVILVVLLIVALMNAPVQATRATTRSLSNYLEAVAGSGIPFVAAVGVAAAIMGLLAARAVRRVWPDTRRRKEMLAAYAFLAPYLVITLIFTVGVVLFAFYIAFTEYGIFDEPEWVGLDNYLEAFSQKDFLQSLHNVLWYALIVTPIQTAIAIAMAVLLNAPIRARQFFRTIFYAPAVTSSVVITLIFIWLYLRTGYVNAVLENVLGIFGVEWEGLTWLGDPRGLIQLILEPFGVTISSDLWYLRGLSIAWMALMVQNIFTTVPTFMIMFLAALQDINPTLYEAAAIDGANGWQQFWKVTLPLLRPIIVLVLVLGTIGTLQVFDQIYLATAGGPLGTTLTPVYVVYSEALGTEGPIQMGYGSALAFILAVIIFVFTFLQRRFIERGAELY